MRLFCLNTILSLVTFRFNFEGANTLLEETYRVKEENLRIR